MNKRHLKPWYFLIAAVLSTLVCILALRANNEHMIHLRDAVHMADQNNTDVVGALQKLQSYVTTHMNTNLNSGSTAVYPPIQLQYTYQRLLQSNNASANQRNSQIYTDAQNYCQAKIPTGFSGSYRISCIESYVQSHNAQLPTIPTALYEFDFVSPSWSPDLAGWTLLLTIISWPLFITSLSIHRWLVKK